MQPLRRSTRAAAPARPIVPEFSRTRCEITAAYRARREAEGTAELTGPERKQLKANECYSGIIKDLGLEVLYLDGLPPPLGEFDAFCERPIILHGNLPDAEPSIQSQQREEEEEAKVYSQPVLGEWCLGSVQVE